MIYVIGCTTRTGSTLLCDLLAQTYRHGQAHEFYEPILFEQLVKPLSGFSDFDREVADPAGYLTKLRSALSSNNGAFGVKVQARQLAWFRPAFTTSASDALRGARYIRLSREDRLGQAISGVKALQTGSWHSGIAPSVEPRFDADAISQQLEKIAGWEAQWDAFFDETGIIPLSLTYEQLVADLPKALMQVGDYIGLPVEESEARSLQPRICRQADCVNAEWREAFTR
jgi:LPS sulfotransferase NodH